MQCGKMGGVSNKSSQVVQWLTRLPHNRDVPGWNLKSGEDRICLSS